MNLEELTFKQVCNCLGLIKKLVVENIINFDIDTGIATLNYDNATKYLENQNLEQKQEIERLSKEVDMWNKKYNEQFDIIKELEKWLEEQIKISQAHNNQLGVNVCNTFKNKLNELKGDSSNE